MENDSPLLEKITALLNKSDFLTLGTCCQNNPSAANIYFANDGLDLYFFTFNPSRKAQQIKYNNKVQCVVRPDGEPGIKELQIDGYAQKVTDQDEIKKAKAMILRVTEAFSEYMDDDFLIKNRVVSYYKIHPTVIKYVDFHAEKKFEWIEINKNEPPLTEKVKNAVKSKLLLYVHAIRAPFLTASLIPVALGTAMAYFQTAKINWHFFWLTLLAVLFAHSGANVLNDFFDHRSRNDESNKLFSPMNGGSRIIQSGLMSSFKILTIGVICFIIAIVIGFHINQQLAGSFLALTPMLTLGFAGIFLGVTYTGILKLSYHGWGDIAVFLALGVFLTLGAYCVQQYALSQNHALRYVLVIFSSMPISILVSLILFINGFQDYNADKATGKETWIVKLAGNEKIANYTKPFQVYKYAMRTVFIYILLLTLYSFIKPGAATIYLLMALVPYLLYRMAEKKGANWLTKWDNKDANRERLPYELLTVNALTIAIHFSVGSLTILAYCLSVWLK